jgi:hypothetical protein
MKFVRLLPILMIGMALVACAPSASTSTRPSPTSTQYSQPTATAPTSQPTATVQAESTSAPTTTADSLTRVDEQGAVVIRVTPLNLTNPGETVDFEVDMNTHSVDLGMNLAELATLTTDTGQKIAAVKWEAPGGGHHVAGKLLFPSTTGGKPLLQGATKLALSLRDVSVPGRVFTWDLK